MIPPREQDMTGTHLLQGLMKWLIRDEWRDRFAEIYDGHLLPACDQTDLDVNEIRSILGEDWFMRTVWGCAFEDFLTRDFEYMLGTAPNSAVVTYINQKKVPHLFLSVNGDKWGDYQKYPWTMGFAPSARTESQIYTKYALQQNPKARFAILYQNDDIKMTISVRITSLACATCLA